jgi:hypothetical protein
MHTGSITSRCDIGSALCSQPAVVVDSGKLEPVYQCTVCAAHYCCLPAEPAAAAAAWAVQLVSFM